MMGDNLPSKKKFLVFPWISGNHQVFFSFFLYFSTLFSLSFSFLLCFF